MKDVLAMVVAIFGIVVMIIFILGLSFLCVAGLFWVICWCFGWVFSWPVALGIWIIVLILNFILTQNNKN